MTTETRKEIYASIKATEKLRALKDDISNDQRLRGEVIMAVRECLRNAIGYLSICQIPYAAAEIKAIEKEGENENTDQP